MGSEAPGTLFVVATPIGNLEDLTPRAARILAECDLVAAEDTRVTGRLLARLGVKKTMISYRDETERRLAPYLVERLVAGETIALVSDAGTPAISDPGYRLVRAAAAADVPVVPIAGPSAVVTLLSASGLPTDRFVFEGFLPARRGRRRTALERYLGAGATVVLYESPRRVAALLEDIAEVLGDPETVVGRELTKMYEEILRGRASELAAELGARVVRGEVVVAVYVEESVTVELEGDRLLEEVAKLTDAGLSTKEAAARLKERGVRRRDVYEAARELSERES